MDPHKICNERDPYLCDLRPNVRSVDPYEACPDEAAAWGSRALNRYTAQVLARVQLDGFRLEAVKKNVAATLYSRRWKASLPNAPTVAMNPASAQAYGRSTA